MATAPQLPALLFDLDGTLIDTIELLLRSARHAFEGWPVAPTDAEWIAGIGTPLVKQLRAYTQTDDDVALLLARYRRYQSEHHDRLTRCYNGVPEVVAELSARGYPLAIVTSKATPIANQSLRFVGLDKYFPVIVGFDDTQHHKPHPEPVLHAIDRLGAAPERTAFVGDSPHDIHSGTAAGVVTVAATWGPFDRETLAAARPNHFIDCMGDLLGVLDRAFGV